MSLCRRYVREFRRTVIVDELIWVELSRHESKESSNNDGKSRTGSQVSLGPSLSVARKDIRASAEKILYTFLLPGAEREIVLPGSITQEIISAIEEDGRDDPEVLGTAKDYVFRAMDRDAFPGFLNPSRPLFRIFEEVERTGLIGE